MKNEVESLRVVIIRGSLVSVIGGAEFIKSASPCNKIGGFLSEVAVNKLEI